MQVSPETPVPRLFREKIAIWPEAPVFVALDGAKFANLPALLQGNEFKALSLFLEQNDAETRRVSPYFVSVEPKRLAAFLALPGITQGGVFWNAPSCESIEFYRHLRSLGMVSIPSTPEQIERGRKPMRRVVFRHFDPGTVAITLPALRPAQRARMLGPAQSLLIDAPEGVLEAWRQPDWPEAEKGPLTFTEDQMRLIRRGLDKRKRYPDVIEFLREFVPPSMQTASDDGLVRLISEADAHTHDWGLQTTGGLANLSFLSCISKGQVYAMESVRLDVNRPGEADKTETRLKELVCMVIRDLGREGYY